jgi:hypothetical protein
LLARAARRLFVAKPMPDLDLPGDLVTAADSGQLAVRATS